MATLMISQQSCKKDDTTVTPTTTPTPILNLVGTWEVSGVTISYGSSNYSPSATEISKTSFQLFNIVFTDDGKYKTAQKSGTWTYVDKVIKLDGNSFTTVVSDINTFYMGNSWIGFGTGNASGLNGNPSIAELNAISVSGTIMQDVYNIKIPTSSRDVSYLMTYKKK